MCRSNPETPECQSHYETTTLGRPAGESNEMFEEWGRKTLESNEMFEKIKEDKQFFGDVEAKVLKPGLMERRR